MNYAIQYHKISGDWLIFDIRDGFELVGIHRNKKDAQCHAKQLQQITKKRAKWNNDPFRSAA